MVAPARRPKIVYPEGTQFDADGYPRIWSLRYKCWMYPVIWDTRTGTIIYAVQPKQWELLKLTPLMRHKSVPGPNRIGYGGAAGGGKSYLARVVATMVAQLWPGSTCAIIRETEQQLKDNHVTNFHREVPQEMYSFNANDMEVKWLATKSLTHFRYLRHEKDLANFQGPAYDVLIFEEATLLNWKLVHWILGNRNRASVPGTTPFALFPTNPGGQGHHEFVRLFIDRRYDPDRDEQESDYAFLPAKLADNHVLQVEDPGYIRKLNTLPEPYRSWQRDGDFHAGAGRAIPQLDRRRHIVPFFVPPPHWFCFGAFDWGFQHPFSFGYYAVNEDGRVFKCDTVIGRHLNPDLIADRINESLRMKGLDPSRLKYISAGHDCWHEHKARGESGPTIAEKMGEHGFPLIRANISRISGLQNLRDYLAWEGRGGLDDAGQPQHDDPGLVFMNTPGNLETVKCLETRVPDPDNIEDVLKTDADAFGEGGDDTYDETRYGLKSRPARAPSLLRKQNVDAWSPATLAREADASRRVSPGPIVRNDVGLVHPEFGYFD